MATATCPKCGISRGAELQCPACGVIYAKAEAALAERTAREAALAASVMVIPAGISEPPPVDDPALELKLCIGAIPAALVLAVLFHILMPGLQRIALGMPVHELGHATCAWFTGHFAIPTLWKTPVWDKGFVFPILLFGLFCWMIFSAWRKEKIGLAALGGAFILLQAWGTLVLSAKAADALIVFGGDGIGMVIATALMCLFFFGKETQLYQGWLRWGFLVIGAAAFVDMYATWWAARTDFGRIPFGHQEYVGASDPVRLVDDFGWPTEVMVKRYLVLGLCCLAALAAVYAWGVWQAKKAADARAT
jgi:hypothetical protein